MRFAFIIPVLFICASINAQIVYSDVPADMRLYPRDTKDSAGVNFKGKVTTTLQDSIVVKTYVNNVFKNWQASKLSYGMDNTAAFNLSYRIHADTVNYKFMVYLRSNGGTYQLINTYDNVVCGDIFLIDGQSNAVASNGGTKTTDKFLRSFGKSVDVNPYNAADTTWGLAFNGANDYYGVGAWAYEMMRLLKNQFGVPIAIINGAGSGTGIETHKRNASNLLDLSTYAFYGKLLYRAQKAHVDKNVKAILWHQGEADVNAPEFWVANFKMLVSQWKMDYPALTQVYFYQIHQGCVIDEGIGSSKFREWQRNVPDSLPTCRIMSTVGITDHDGCHFYPTGYKTIGLWMFRLVARDYYGYNFGYDVAAPNIKKAFYTNGNRNEIALVFKNNQQVVWTESMKYGGVDRYIKDYFYLNGVGKVVSNHRINKDTLFLILKAPSTANKITYLPDNLYAKGDVCYEGPWIMGTNGVGLLSFFEVSVTCQNNNYPTLKQKTVNVSAYAGIGTPVDTVKGTDPDGNKLYYSITSGNTDNSFVIDSVTGIVTVQQPLRAAKYYLGLKVHDDGVCNLSATATDVINYKAYSLDEEDAEKISIYPNPSDGSFEVSYASENNASIIISVVDLSGKELYSQIESKTEAIFKKKFQLKVAPGIYLLKVIDNGKIMIEKLRIE